MRRQSDPLPVSAASSHRFRGKGSPTRSTKGCTSPLPSSSRTIEDVGLDNFGINLDPANLIFYGHGHSLDALDVFGPYVRSVLAKDLVYATHGYELGAETLLCDGNVDFPTMLSRHMGLG